MGGNGQHWNAASVTVEQPIDEMEVTRTTAACAYRQLAGQMRLGTRGEGGSLFMSHVNPGDFAQSPEAVGKAVQRISDDSIDSTHPSLTQGSGHKIGTGFRSWFIPPNG